MKEITYTPIALFRCENAKPYGAPRQSVLAKNSTGIVSLNPNLTKDCVSDLVGFDRIWLIYDFHNNKSWKPKVRPPRGSRIKRGVFSTRSPYRPNSIGMSCVKLQKIEGLKIYVFEHDLLDGTPILDIKPYLPYADSFEDSKTGWLAEGNKFEVKFTSIAAEKISWLAQKLGLDVPSTVQTQLEYDPTCGKAKRVRRHGEGYVFSLQAWRLPFTVTNKVVQVSDLISGYSNEELSNEETPFAERALHASFRKLFAN